MAGLFKKIVKGILIGGGTALSLLCPPAGVAVVTAGMAIGAGAKAIGGLIKTEKPYTIDSTVTKVNQSLSNAGLLQPAVYPSATLINTSGPAVLPTNIRGWAPWVIGAAIVLFIIFKLFNNKRRR